jgi:hypothetical protein
LGLVFRGPGDVWGVFPEVSFLGLPGLVIFGLATVVFWLGVGLGLAWLGPILGCIFRSVFWFGFLAPLRLLTFPATRPGWFFYGACLATSCETYSPRQSFLKRESCFVW